MKQLTIFSTPEKSCAFTGHRSLGEDFNKRKLRKAIQGKIKAGVDTFYTGMAKGFDLLAAEYVLSFKRKTPQIKLIACIPCEGQSKYFPDEEKRLYEKIMLAADERVVLSDHYYNGCMRVRNEYMVDRADCLIAYCTQPTGGTASTVRYFKRKHPDGEILFI